jgi:cell division protein YceG involved in septum cleavage
MENNVPFAVFEGTQIRHERTVKRLIIALIIAIVLIFASNAIWLYAWCQYDYTSTDETTQSETVDVDAGSGTANYIGDNGDIINGENNSKESNNP